MCQKQKGLVWGTYDARMYEYGSLLRTLNETLVHLLSVHHLAPGLTKHYNLEADPTHTNFTLVKAKLDDEDVPHPGKYKCEVVNAARSKTFYITVVNDLKCPVFQQELVK